MLREKVPIYAKTCSSSWVFVLATKRNSVLGQLRRGEGRRRGVAPPSSIRVPRGISLPDGGTASLRTRLRIRAADERANRGRLRDLWRSRDEKYWPLRFHETSIHQHAPALTLSPDLTRTPGPSFPRRKDLGRRSECGEDDRRARAGQCPHPSRTPVSGPHTS